MSGFHGLVTKSEGDKSLSQETEDTREEDGGQDNRQMSVMNPDSLCKTETSASRRQKSRAGIKTPANTQFSDITQEAALQAERYTDWPECIERQDSGTHSSGKTCSPYLLQIKILPSLGNKTKQNNRTLPHILQAPAWEVRPPSLAANSRSQTTVSMTLGPRCPGLVY